MLVCRLVSLFLLLVSSVAFATETPPTGHAIGSAGFNEMLGKQLGADSLKTDQLPDGSFKLTNTIQTLSAHVHKDGVSFDSIGNSKGKGGFSLSLVQWGREGKLQPVVSSSIYSKENIVYHTHSNGLAEKFSNTSDGIRQDFIVATKPEGAGSLLVQLKVSDGKVQAKNNGAVILLNSGRQLTYDRLAVTDANGKSIPAQISVASNNAINIVVEDSAAQYPLTIDPTVGDENWVSMSGILGVGYSSVVHAIAAYGNDVYVGGSFDFVGHINAARIAKWDGSSWSALGNGMNGDVRALAIDTQGNVYAGGDFITAGGVTVNRIAKWNGSSWSALGSGMNQFVQSLAVDDGGNVYAGGYFTTAGGLSANRIAKWDGSSWSALSSGMNERVFALAVADGGQLYAGGAFTVAGGGSANYVATWNGSGWSPLGSGTSVWINALVFDGVGNLYAGGETGDVAKWNGANWSYLYLTTGLNNTVYSLAIDSSNRLIAGGSFNAADGFGVNRIAIWDGSKWASHPYYGVGAGSVNALAFDGSGNLYMGGNFHTAGSNNVSVNHIAKSNGSSLSPVGLGISSDVAALLIGSSGNLYVSGISAVNGIESPVYIAEFNGSSWSGLPGDGLHSFEGKTIAVDGSDNLYAVAYNYSFGSYFILKWDGSSWNVLGGYMDVPPTAMTVDYDGNLYVSGNFTAPSGLTGYHIAKWSGSSWISLGSGLSGTVSTMILDDNENLYVGGNLTKIGIHNVGRIAKLSGTGWSSLGGGMNSAVSAIAIDGVGNLYAGGSFTTAGGLSANHIAKWNGSSWSALDSGMNNTVYALAVDSSDSIYAGGSFTTASGLSANRIAKWNGSSWRALGSGMNNTVYALAVDGSDSIYAGGLFTTAGGKVSAYLAKWIASSRLKNDLDADNDSDLLTRSASLGTWTRYTVQNAVITGSGSMNADTSSNVQYVAQLDANGDGDADILTRNTSTGAWYLHQVQNGSVTGTTPIYLYANLDQQFIGAGDFNGDGTDDVMLRSTSGGYYTVFLLANHAVDTTVFYNAWTSSQSVPQGVGDFDGDGTDDLLVRRTSDNLYFVFKTTNGGTTNNYCACNIWNNPDWTFQFAGDTNKDGTDDIVIRGTGATGNGQWWNFRMQNFSSTQTTNLNTFLNKTQVSFAASGDYNADGHTDMLIRVNNGPVYVARIMNGLVSGSTTLLSNLPADSVVLK